jgi:hypothetical protein
VAGSWKTSAAMQGPRGAGDASDGGARDASEGGVGDASEGGASDAMLLD